MAELKTRLTGESVVEFLNTVEDENKRKDCFAILDLMQEVTGSEAEMWGSSIVGFGRYHYRYSSGREADWLLVGFSPRKQNLTLYITSGFDEYGNLMSKLGKHTTSKSCLYVKRLADVDQATLKELVRLSVEHMRRTNP